MLLSKVHSNNNNNNNKRKTDGELIDIPLKRKTGNNINEVFENLKSYQEGGKKNAQLINAILYTYDSC